MVFSMVGGELWAVCQDTCSSVVGKRYIADLRLVEFYATLIHSIPTF